MRKESFGLPVSTRFSVGSRRSGFCFLVLGGGKESGEWRNMAERGVEVNKLSPRKKKSPPSFSRCGRADRAEGHEKAVYGHHTAKR